MKTRVNDHDEWLQLRSEVITATEAPTLLGLNRWTSPNKMWQEKQHSTFTGNAYTYLGHLLEPIVVEVTNDMLDTEFEVIENDKGKLFYRHPKMKLGATPDAMEKHGNNVTLLECKTTKALNFLKYRSSPPPYYIMQLIIQMMCVGTEEGYLAILGTDLTQHSEELDMPIAIFKVNKINRLCELMEQELERFWTTVEKDAIFRVNSQVKKEASMLIQLAYNRIY